VCAPLSCVMNDDVRTVTVYIQNKINCAFLNLVDWLLIGIFRTLDSAKRKKRRERSTSVKGTYSPFACWFASFLLSRPVIPFVARTALSPFSL
jgi:hypothetical protein